MVGPIYKLTCVAAAAIGLIAAFPMATYAFIMGVANLSNGGTVILMVIGLPILAIVWGVLRTLLRLKSAAPSSFIAPTIAGVIGIVLTIVGIPFAQNAPGYY